MRRLALLALLAVSAACAGLGLNDDIDAIPLEPSPPPPMRDAAADAAADAREAATLALSLEIGLGATGFQAIADGAPAEIIAGPQGGYHVWTAVRVNDPTLVHAIVNLSATFEATGERAGTPIAEASLFVADGDHAVAFGLRTLLADPDRARGQRVRLQAELVVGDGGIATDSRTITVR